MSLFQCDKCGCCENTSLTNTGHYELSILFRKEAVMLSDCRTRLGLPADAELGRYCSACTPLWFTPEGDFGFGINPNPEPGKGLWHGKFPQKFYPLGSMVTDRDGNLKPKPQP